MKDEETQPDEEDFAERFIAEDSEESRKSVLPSFESFSEAEPNHEHLMLLSISPRSLPIFRSYCADLSDLAI